ncbi:receptor-type tyrosine-protein phosphatase C [Entelurus aequoreus]|uniref:receptor-type tyrosine-protein phosphatase C n=1 Tax=Entelurus aequoreus TaxID=161455 RepID=UPI002B1D851A|nr:receptor-type tyrosine-protein phosphatase C [Entelurus aequoreus]
MGSEDSKVSNSSTTTPAAILPPISNNVNVTNDSKVSNSSTTTPPATVPPISYNVNVTNASAPIQCSYSVTPIPFGFRFIINSSATGVYNIALTEDGQELRKHSNTTSINILDLKPCTEYEHTVNYHNDKNKEQGTGCNFTNLTPKTRTKEMSQNVTYNVTSDGCLSVYSGWNINTSLSAPKNSRVEFEVNKVCIRPAFSDICSRLTTDFNFARNCTSFSLTTFFSADDFLIPKDIKQDHTSKLPINITAHLPPKCTNHSTVYSCLDASNTSTIVSDLEPFTNYICTGDIMEHSATRGKLPPLPVRIDCDLDIQIKHAHPTNESIKMEWTTESVNCADVVSNGTKLSYQCTCERKTEANKIFGPSMASKHQDHFRCHVTGLSAFTDYLCTIQPTYNSKGVGWRTTKTLQTTPGVPDDITNLKAILVDNNEIEVTCDHSKQFYGPKTGFNAVIQDSVTVKTKNQSGTCKFTFTDLSYSTTYKVEVFAFNEFHKSKDGRPEQVSTSYNDKALTGFLIFLIIFTSVALLIVLVKIYMVKRQRSQDMHENMLLIPNAKNFSVEPIEADTLLDAYKRKLADEGRLFLDEFQSIPRIFTRLPMKEAKKPCNALKNRYVDILPYDSNRVQLRTGNGEAGCDYINASFIDGYNESKKYIAAQGPKEETVCDFWRMIWEQKSSIIVMVTRCEEGNKVKCVQYWPSPDRETEIYEEFVVKLLSEDYFPDYIIRNLILTNRREKSLEREVTHIQFISWPDHGVPGEPHLLLKLRRQVNAFKDFFSGPIVVHCSAGVGRTGTYIGIDAMMECLEAESRVDIYRFVFNLRRQRCLMVQVEAQYILIHQALLEHNQFGETEISLSELHSTLSMLKDISSANEPTLLEEEFKRLPTYTNWRTFNTGITEENKAKNRCSSIIPYDYNRVLLSVGEGSSCNSTPDEDDEEQPSDEEEEEKSTAYINASNIHGYSNSCTFIAAQSPLDSTMADFWLMVYQKKASTIVMLEANGEEKESAFLESKEVTTYGDIEVQVQRVDDNPSMNIIHRIMLIRHVKRKEKRTVMYVQFLKWGSRELPEKPQVLTDMIKEVKRGKTPGGAPVVVQCSDGSSRCGIFCALWNLLDSAETEKTVDVFQEARTLRKERKGMIANLDQYQFLYDALDGVYPVKNGEVKPIRASEVDSVLLVNETQSAEEADGPTLMDQQREADSSGKPVAETGMEDDGKKPEKVSGDPTETTP